MKIAPSPIHGHGVFTELDYPDGYQLGCICPVVKRGKYFVRFERNNIARFLNHADTPNCEIVLTEEGLFLITKQSIRQGTELTLDYNAHTSLITEEAERLNIALLIF
jgi:SET domain-containing protein